MRAAALVEKLGIPSVSIVSSGFLKQAELVARGLSVPLAVAEYPGHPMGDSTDELQRKVERVVAHALLQALTREAAVRAEGASEPGPGEEVFRGTFDEVQEYFHSRLWTDGLPIVPPTRERVESFLAC